MRWRWWHTRLRLHEADNVHASVLGEVAPARVVRNDGLPLYLSDQRRPGALRRVQCRREVCEPAIVLRLSGWIQLDEPVAKEARDAAAVCRVEPVMWIAAW